MHSAGSSRSQRASSCTLPAALRLPDNVKRVDVRASGCERIIAPLGQTWDSFFLNGPPVADDFMQARASQDQPEREAL